MELRRDLLLPIIILVAIATLTSFGAIGILDRMSPAIQRILAENVFSLEAVEEMLAITAELDGAGATAQQRDRFELTLQRAAANITEPEEREQMAEIQQNWRRAFAGDASARKRVIAAMRELGAINRKAMARADKTARRLGAAGAWTAVFLGVFAFLWGVLAVRRAHQRILHPLSELESVVEAYHGGDRFRRCAPVPAPAEIQRVMHALDALLDHWMIAHKAPPADLSAVAARAALLHVLDAHAQPMFLVDARGQLELANTMGMERLEGDAGPALRDQLRAAPSGETPPGMRCQHIERAELWLCELDDKQGRDERPKC